jgi:ABC-type transport system involved in cytochrome bd biosynthesis fused ATPase/permease subunit
MDAALLRIDRTDKQLAALEKRSAAGLAFGSGLAALAAGLGLWGAFVVTIPAVRSGALPGVMLAVVVLLAWSSADVVADLPAVGQHLSRARQSARRMVQLAQLPIPVIDPVHPVPCPSHPTSVRLSGVSAHYAADRPSALVDVDLELHPGSRIVVTGKSGAGKSTLLAVLLRFLDVDAGVMTIDGIDVRAMNSDDVRRVIGCCEQEPHLFDSTIRANILIGSPKATQPQVRSAISRAGLDRWIDSLPDGLDTQVGEGGCEVSGGEGRRISLARAFLADFPVLLLDEPTEGLDELAARCCSSRTGSSARRTPTKFSASMLRSSRSPDAIGCGVAGNTPTTPSCTPCPPAESKPRHARYRPPTSGRTAAMSMAVVP